MIRTRFAPSPTGLLHIGHAYSALFSFNEAIKQDGEFILRIEDIDINRCKDEYEKAIYEDLKWLGLSWPEPVRRQSDYLDDYKNAVSQLLEINVLYPCFCTRKDIQRETKLSAIAPHGPEGPIYPGTCKHLEEEDREKKISENTPYAFRRNVDKARKHIGHDIYWFDYHKGKQKARPETLGDIVIARKDIMTSYHLSVTLDDHLQDISIVTRGEDLFYATHMHRLLQELLNLNVPEWHHHNLLLDDKGKRFAKRNKSVTLKELRENENKNPEDIMKMIGLSLEINKTS
jgi:glutamyl-Q tRNA(Asp) synthetase